MPTHVTIAADDFGLSRGVTDSILETVDAGPVRMTSILANGEAFEYAIAEYLKRADRLSIAVHLNLTEGPALSPASAVPHLADERGNFRYSVTGLWLRYASGTPAFRRALRAEIRTELQAQCDAVRAALGEDAIAVNGHQHVHLLPFVFDELLTIPGLSYVRTVREPFSFTASPVAALSRATIALLSRRAARMLADRAIATNDGFVGFAYSGRMTQARLKTGLLRARGAVEALFHPGSASPGELSRWRDGRADISWHYAKQRDAERAVLLDKFII